MELVLVRHGRPKRVVVNEGRADPGLDETGARQAEALADYLSQEPLDAIWTSPMVRARETAAPLSARLGLTPLVHDGIAEWDRDSSEYITVEEMKWTNDPRWLALQTGQWAGGLDPHAFQAEVVVAVEEIVREHPGQHVAVVCHGGVIGAYLAHILEVPRPGGFFYPAYTSISRVMASSNGQRTITSLNEITHLFGKGLGGRQL